MAKCVVIVGSLLALEKFLEALASLRPGWSLTDSLTHSLTHSRFWSRRSQSSFKVLSKFFQKFSEFKLIVQITLNSRPLAYVKNSELNLPQLSNIEHLRSVYLISVAYATEYLKWLG